MDHSSVSTGTDEFSKLIKSGNTVKQKSWGILWEASWFFFLWFCCAVPCHLLPCHQYYHQKSFILCCQIITIPENKRNKLRQGEHWQKSIKICNLQSVNHVVTCNICWNTEWFILWSMLSSKHVLLYFLHHSDENCVLPILIVGVYSLDGGEWVGLCCHQVLSTRYFFLFTLSSRLELTDKWWVVKRLQWPP